jgi:hypothetical protein
MNKCFYNLLYLIYFLKFIIRESCLNGNNLFIVKTWYDKIGNAPDRIKQDDKAGKNIFLPCMDLRLKQSIWGHGSETTGTGSSSQKWGWRFHPTSPHSGIVLGVDDYRWKCAINERGKAEWIMINSPSLKKRCSNGWNAQYFDVKE